MRRNTLSSSRRLGFSTMRTVMTAVLTVALGFLGLIAAREYHLAHGQREVVERWELRAKSAGEYLRGITPSGATPTTNAAAVSDDSLGPATDGLRRPAHPRVVVLLARSKIQLLDGDRLLREWEVRLPRSQPSQLHPSIGVGVPTGLFYICGKTSFTPRLRFLTLSYPSVPQSDAAVGQGRITPAEAASIRRAVARRQPPPTDTALGGPLGIQGTGSSPSPDPPGQISLTMADADVAMLYRIVDIGDPVEIVAPDPPSPPLSSASLGSGGQLGQR